MKTKNRMDRKEENEDTVTKIKFENSIFVKPEFIKNEPAPVDQNTPSEDCGHGGSNINLDQIKTELSVEDNMAFEQKGGDLGFQYFNSDVDNIKLEYTAKGSQSSEHDSLKTEIKEEPDRESTQDTFDDSDLNEYSLKIEIEENETKFMPYEEKQMNEKDFPQEKESLGITNTVEVHSSDKEQHTTHTAEENSLKCETCGKQFARKNNLNRHMRSHTGEKPYQCDICLKRFSRESHLKTHLRVHTGETPYNCDICFKRFSRKSHLKTHLRVHTGEKIYKCEICFKQFSYLENIKQHMLIHTGEKPYKCEICFKPFNASHHLKNHIRTHTGEKPHKCEICFKQFTQSGSLKKHLRTH